MSDDETTIRDRLRRLVDGPPPDEDPPQPLVQVHVIPEPTTAQDDDEDQDDEEDDEPETRRPWWHTLPGPFGSSPVPEPEPTPQERLAAAPGIHVTVHQPPPAPPWVPPADPAAARAEERLYRRRIWFAYHAGAAGAGWFLGLPQLMDGLLADAGPAAAPAGIALALVSWIVASYLPGLPYIPPPVQPVIVWASRIPVCSAVLALALHAPGTL
ncbi:hypothetical protein [Streptomyces nitrosporeus]|uniref:hypothetical protein n=1 Tax=Streptomyces nitrosporeus TaxID=28894 RepID=UPI0039A328C3